MTVLERIVRAAGRRPGRVLALVAVLAAAGTGLALRLEPSAATDTLVGGGAETYKATERYREQFGDHSVLVLVRGGLPNLLLTANLGRLIGLEGCLSDNKPADQEAPGGANGPCGRLAALKPVKVVYGPGTFANASAGEINDQIQVRMRAKAAEADRAGNAARQVAKAQGKSKAEQDKVADSARQLVYAQFLRDLLQINLKYGLSLSGLPSVDDPNFVAALFLDPSRGADEPKPRFAYLVPSKSSALIQVRLKPELTDAQRAQAVELVRAAVRMPEWRLKGDAGYTVTGAPVVAEDLTDALAGSTLRLLLVGLAVMALVLCLVFRSRLRLLPLAVALAAVAITFGLMALLGAPLTMASIAALPVLLGLGVDYAIQYQSRTEVSVIATAALATGAGFLVLLLSPVPMVREFGVLLVLGIAIAFALALTAGTAALALRARGGALARSTRGAGELIDGAATAVGRRLAPVRRAGMAAVGTAVRYPRQVLIVGLVIAAAGWAVDSRTEVVSDVERLVPQDLPAVQDLQALQRATGVAGEIDVVVEGDDLTEPAVVKWMRDYQSGLLKRYGYSTERGCGRAELCPALSLPDLFRTEQSASDRAKIRALLDAVPPYFSSAVITGDRKTANLAFGIRLTSLERQQQIIEQMRADLPPPAGVNARLAGLPVLAAEANDSLSDPLRRLGSLVVGLLA